MRKWYLALAALLLVNFLGLWPFQQIDTGELFIVDTLVITPEGDAVRVMAEEISGQGLTMEAALDDLQEHAPGQLFLRQVRRLILCQDLRLAPQSLPREVPAGAYVYHTAVSADALPLDRLQRCWRPGKNVTPTP